MTAEEQADLQAGLKEAMAKTREENLKYIKEHNLGGMIAAREGLDKLKEKASGIVSEIKDNFKADEGPILYLFWSFMSPVFLSEFEKQVTTYHNAGQ